MMKDFTCAVVAAFALLLADSSSALPVTRRSSSATETGSSRSGSSSGSASGSGDDCDRELSASNQETLISNIDSLLAGLETTLREVRVSGWQLRATVGVYDSDTGILDSSISDCSARPSEYGYAIAYSVSRLQMFLRPIGDALTNETVREVIERQAGFSGKFFTIHGKLATLTKDVYTLVKGNSSIHRCVLPGLPLADTNTVLNPTPPPQVRDACYRDMIVDGLANELQELVIKIDLALDCLFDRN